MKVQEFIEEFEEILMVESGSIAMDTNLNDLVEWDSLTKIALSVLLEEKFETKLEVKSLDEIESFSDIFDIIKDKLEM